MKVIFLDFDGVLNNEPFLRKSTGSFAPENIAALNALLRAVPDAMLVISSTWRRGRTAGSLAARLEAEGMLAGRVWSVTPDLDRPVAGSKLYLGTPRGAEIRAWLDEHTIESHVILDDDDDMDGTDPSRFVQTTMLHGLTLEDAKRAMEILNR